MKLVGLFNRIDAGNIGLENFMNQRSIIERRVVALQQSCSEAVAEVVSNYPECRMSVVGLSRQNGGVILRGVSLLMSYRPSVMHAHHAQAALLGVVVRCLPSTRLVTTAHNDFRFYKLRHKFAFGMAYLMSDRVVCNSKGTLASLPWFVRSGKTSVIYNGVDFRKLDRVMETSRRKRIKAGVVVGTVCRMVPQKDLLTLVNGFAKAVKRSKQPLSLRLVGDGELRVKIERLTRKLNIESSVSFTGSVSREEVYRNLVDMDIFVVSSRWEGFCNAMVEAAAAGKAIIATEIDPLPEVIGWQNAEFFQVGNSDELCAKILMLAGNGDRFRELVSRGRDFVRKRYSMGVSASQYGQLYEELAGELRIT